ncbi:MAG: tRNA (guanine(37)-N(1))-methyltransferase [Patescibacteria group bacterium]|nr:tRNA (guanine(37)-N(1))-methyltransferase [Patescibacteria group bacterium]
MKIYILTLFPQMISSFFSQSVVKKAVDKKLVEINLIDLRDFAHDKRGSVDDRVYGGGKGMIIRVDVVDKALEKLKVKSQKLPVCNAMRSIAGRQFSIFKQKKSVSWRKETKIILTSPKGKVFNQEKAVEYSKLDELVIICGHYEGVDERVKNFIDEEVSLGDFIMTGGEITASAIVDSVVRLIPSVLAKEATQKESFSEYSIDYLISLIGENETLKKLKNKKIKKIKLLEYPQYTRPENYQGLKVPKILLSGNHKEIEKWRIKKAWEETVKKRKDLLV